MVCDRRLAAGRQRGPKPPTAPGGDMAADDTLPVDLVAKLVPPRPEPPSPVVQLMLPGETHGAKYGMGDVSNFACGLTDPRLGHGNGEQVWGLFGGLDGVVCASTGSRCLGCKLCHQMLDGLQLRDRATELHAL